MEYSPEGVLKHQNPRSDPTTLRLPQATEVAATAESFNVAIAEKPAGRFMIRSKR
jgi:hypothetical protein